MAPEVAEEPVEVVQAAAPQDAPEEDSSWFSFGGIFDSVSDTVEDVTDAIFLNGDDDSEDAEASTEAVTEAPTSAPIETEGVVEDAEAAIHAGNAVVVELSPDMDAASLQQLANTPGVSKVTYIP